jgi:hypothetical protein
MVKQSQDPHSDEYRRYLQSQQWKEKCARKLKEAKHCCERCGIPEEYARLEVHHKTYERLGNELSIDLEVVCVHCHPIADQERSYQSKRRSMQKLDNARFQGWVRKVYGDNYDPDEYTYERYQRWLERKRDYDE